MIVPYKLRQLHEDNKVVFFCGSGVSAVAGLPDFKGLTDELIKGIGLLNNSEVESALQEKKYDISLGLLEKNTIDGRNSLRQNLASILSLEKADKPNVRTHQAILTLSRGRDKKTRLVTTNFDQLFELADELGVPDKNLKRFEAPLLPIPDISWNGLAYLHGKIPKPKENEQEGLDELVLTSADFGRAYLSDGWAARFITKLFREHTICFVGYSINDPILRYIVDALAAEKQLGEDAPEMFAFAAFSETQADKEKKVWEAKNVIPILYPKENKHSLLHQTLIKWSEDYIDGEKGKERIVLKLLERGLDVNIDNKDLINEMVWALSDISGSPAKLFAQADPLPSFKWLSIFEQHNSPVKLPCDKFIVYGNNIPELDPVAKSLGNWLVRHANNPDFLIWLTSTTGRLHPCLESIIEQQINDNLTESSLSITDNEKIDSTMKVLWRYYFQGSLKTQNFQISLYRWKRRYQADGMTAIVKRELRQMFSVYVSLERFSISTNDKPKPDTYFPKITIPFNNIYGFYNDLSEFEQWQSDLPSLLPLFSDLLQEALEIDNHIKEERIASSIYLCSISSHLSNQRAGDWTILIIIVRDAWLALSMQSSEKARAQALDWFNSSNPVFVRLALFAACDTDIIPVRGGLEWLLANNNHWLWDDETQREVCRLLVTIYAHLDHEDKLLLEKTILAGPPKDKKSSECENSNSQDSNIWLRLKKLESTGVALSKNASRQLASLSNKYPGLRLHDDEREEIINWWPIETNNLPTAEIPAEIKGMLQFLQTEPEDPFQQDNWAELCSDYFELTSDALKWLAEKNKFYRGNWQTALGVWRQEKYHLESYKKLVNTLLNFSDQEFRQIIRSVSSWLESIAKTIPKNDELFIQLAQKIIDLAEVGNTDFSDNPLLTSMHHPVGETIGALLQYCSIFDREKGTGLPEEILRIFSEVCMASSSKYQYGRVILARWLAPLFSIIPDWSTQNLLPLFNWNTNIDTASYYWQAYLNNPHLFSEVIAFFLLTSQNYKSLKQSGPSYARALTYFALDNESLCSQEELQEAYSLLPEEGLVETLETLIQALINSDERKNAYWTNRIEPFIINIWPKGKDKWSDQVAEKMAFLCLATDDQFDIAFILLKKWLGPVYNINPIVSFLMAGNLCERFPEESLSFLGKIIDIDMPLFADLADRVAKCLDEIEKNDANLSKLDIMQKLREHVSRARP